MAAQLLITSLLLLFLCVHSVAVTAGFNDFLDSIKELLNDTERLMNANNSTVVDSVVNRLQCAAVHRHDRYYLPASCASGRQCSLKGSVYALPGNAN